MKVTYLIIGAGPTGLGAAYRLKQAKIGDFLLLEQSSHVGGLASSMKDEAGFTWDIGGHVQFSHYPYFDEAMNRVIPADQWLHHQRESWVWICNRFVPYPFQNNIGFLPKEKMWRCLKELIPGKNGSELAPENFREWILASFGSGIAEEFMLPYNFKVWAYPAADMNYTWIGERVATVDFARILENVLFEKMDASWGPNNTFHFPPEGGTGAIWEKMADLVGREFIRLNSEVEVVSPDTRKVTLQNGEVIFYDHLISTIPLDILASRVEGIPEGIRSAASCLRHSSSNIVGIGIKGKIKPELQTKCWMYFPEDTTPFYRLTVFSNYSPRNVPGSEFYSLMAEVSESPHKPVDRKSLIEEVEKGLLRIGFIGPEDQVVSRWSYTAEYGYPIPSRERDKMLSLAVPYLDSLGVYSRGRFGGWKYEVSNQDHSFMQGVEIVEKILMGKEESTFKVDRQDQHLKPGLFLGGQVTRHSKRQDRKGGFIKPFGTPAVLNPPSENAVKKL